jgi:hypothetical protein
MLTVLIAPCITFTMILDMMLFMFLIFSQYVPWKVKEEQPIIISKLANTQRRMSL